jgi:hypothetical protein
MNFAAFILTHGRPDKVFTYKTLRNHGYTGKIYLIVDDLDESLPLYKKKYKDDLIIFNKAETEKIFDLGDNFKKSRGSVIHARNASFKIAADLELTHFIQLDDDYTSFQVRFNKNLDYVASTPRYKNLDLFFAKMVELFETNPRIKSITMSQSGDFIGGSESKLASNVMLVRKAMNSFVCSPARPFMFVGRINEDVNTYALLGSRGDLFFTTNQVSLAQVATQKATGGNTEFYLSHGTYVKSFYSVIYHPSSITVKMLNSKHSRLHHSVAWNHTVPMILRDHFKK